MEIECPACSTTFKVDPRPVDWSGEIRFHLACPHCSFEFCHRDCPCGIRGLLQPVRLFEFADKRICSIEEYDCLLPEAQAFAVAFRSVLDQLPKSASEKILGYWHQLKHTPHIWLLHDPKEWNGRGYAQASNYGRSLYFASSICCQAPKELLQSIIAHELGHVLCLALDEPTHFLEPSVLQLKKCEWLVWKLMENWRFDQEGVESWAEQNFEFVDRVPQRRKIQLPANECENRIRTWRSQVLEDLKDEVFSPLLEPYLNK